MQKTSDARLQNNLQSSQCPAITVYELNDFFEALRKAGWLYELFNYFWKPHMEPPMTQRSI